MEVPTTPAFGTAELIEAVSGLSEAWKTAIIRDLKTELNAAIQELNDTVHAGVITPPAALMFQWAKLCPYDEVKVVIIGQDPYPTAGQATGLAFSCPKMQPSLRNIYKCLQHYKLAAPEECETGDLSGWAKQGVLLLNMALTTIVGKSNVHAKVWRKYTEAVIRNLCKRKKRLVFILLGGFAGGLDIDAEEHVVFRWGHPSPMNDSNKTDNPRNFKYCGAFSETNKLIATPINWSPAHVPEEQPADVWAPTGKPVNKPCEVHIFTDGGCLKNALAGKENVPASYGCYVTGDEVVCSGIIQNGSNNKGELLAILKGLQFARDNQRGDCRDLVIVTDSQYSLNAINVWSENWYGDARLLEGKKNLDLIKPAMEILMHLRETRRVFFKHINSHKKRPDDPNEQFLWDGNDIADRLCTAALH